MKQLLKASPIVLLLIVLTVATTMQSDTPVPPPLPEGFPHVDADWYVPGEIRGFSGGVIVGSTGTSLSLPTQDVTNGWTEFPSTMSRAAYVSGRFRGQAELWFSGNAIWGYAASTLTKTAAQNRTLCASVTRLAVHSGSTTAPEVCGTRINAWDWVSSDSRNLWTGCTIVAFNNPSYNAINDSFHTFTQHDGSRVSGTSNTTVGYRCATN